MSGLISLGGGPGLNSLNSGCNILTYRSDGEGGGGGAGVPGNGSQSYSVSFEFHQKTKNPL